MFAAEAAVLVELEPLARFLLVLGRAVIAPLALVARQRDDVTHDLALGFRLWALGFGLWALGFGVWALGA